MKFQIINLTPIVRVGDRRSHATRQTCCELHATAEKVVLRYLARSECLTFIYG